MNYPAIVRILSMLGLVQAGLMGALAIFALIFDDAGISLAFTVATLSVVVLALSALLMTSKPERPAHPRDGLAVLVLWWALGGLTGALPYALAAPEAGFIASLQESVSAMTTTGHTVLDFEATGWPLSLIAWRCVQHLLGAMTSLTAAAGIFAALNMSGPGIHRTVLFTIPSGSFFDALPRILWAAGFALAVMVSALFVALYAVGVSPDMAMGDAISVASTGLAMPGRAGSAPTGALHAAILAVGLLVATVGLGVALDLRSGRWRDALRDPELLVLAGMVSLLVAFVAGLGGGVLEAAGWALSQHATSGLPLSDPAGVSDIPVTIQVLPAMVGGSALSTAGGIKLARLAVLVARAGEEFARLGFRRSVVVFRFRGRRQADHVVIGVWVYAVAYTVAFAGLILMLSFGPGGLEASIPGAAGLLSNSGGLVAAAELPGGGPLGLVAVIAMLAGRLEVVLLLPALSLTFWRS